jgi:hypothetical protein
VTKFLSKCSDLIGGLVLDVVRLVHTADGVVDLKLQV